MSTNQMHDLRQKAEAQLRFVGALPCKRRKRGVRRRRGFRKIERSVPALRLACEILRRVPPSLVSMPPLGTPSFGMRYTEAEHDRLATAVYTDPAPTHAQIIQYLKGKKYNLWVWLAIALYPYLSICPHGENYKKVGGTRRSYFVYRKARLYGLSAFEAALGVNREAIMRLVSQFVAEDMVDIPSVPDPEIVPPENPNPGVPLDVQRMVMQGRPVGPGDSHLYGAAYPAPRQSGGIPDAAEILQETLRKRMRELERGLKVRISVPQRFPEGSGSTKIHRERGLSYVLAHLERWLELAEARQDERTRRARLRRIRAFRRKGPESQHFRDSSEITPTAKKRRWLSVRPKHKAHLSFNKLLQDCEADRDSKWRLLQTRAALEHKRVT